MHGIYYVDLTTYLCTIFVEGTDFMAQTCASSCFPLIFVLPALES